MEDEKIKEGIDDFIGKERLMTSALRNKIVLNAQSGSKLKRGTFMNFFRPVLSIALLLIVFGGIYYLITDENKDKETAAEEGGSELEKALLENSELKEQLEQLGSSEELQEAVDEIESLKEQIQYLSDSNQGESLLYPLHLARLKEQDFTGDERDIIAEFVLHPEIIPYDGVLGGTMGFSEEGPRVLSHEWILAPFSDGHVVGHLLVKYKMRDGTPTEWEVIDSYLDGEELD